MNTGTIASKAKIAALSFVFATAVSASVFAGNTPPATPSKEAAAKAFNVKYIGTVEDGYIVNISYDNLAAENFDLIIKDETGEILYQRGFTTKNFSKKYQLSKSLIKAIIIVHPQHADEQSYEVDVQSRFSEDVVVSKL